MLWYAVVCSIMATCRYKRLFPALSFQLFKPSLLVSLSHVLLRLSHFKGFKIEFNPKKRTAEQNGLQKFTPNLAEHVIAEMLSSVAFLEEKPAAQHLCVLTFCSRISMEGLSLSELFNRGQRIFINVRESTLASADPQLQSQIEEAIAYLERASDLVQRLGIFSENEFLDDINANDLRFLLVNAYLGSLILQRTGSNRKAILESSKVRQYDLSKIGNLSVNAQAQPHDKAFTHQTNSIDYLFQKHLLEFLNTCEVHQIIPESDIMLLKRFQDTDTAPRLDAATSREQKIERYKREKEMEGKIKDLQAVLDKAGEKSGETDVDIEDIERDLVMSLVNFHILKSMEHLQSIGQEYVMVLEMEKMRERAALGDATDLRSHTAQPKIDPRNASGPLLSSAGVPLRPFVITSKRQELRDQVFRPGWALPTMTIDEYLQQEEERGNIIKGGYVSKINIVWSDGIINFLIMSWNYSGKEQPEKPEIDDNDHEALDAETMKSRDWDVYKEDNPRGWGKTSLVNRPYVCNEI